MNNNPLVSIIIPAYNSEQWIEEAVNSCLNQSYKNIEVIVVNDGSTDGTLSLVQQISDSRLKVFSQMNMGACVARNRGFDESHGEYVKFFDADDYMYLDAIEKQLNEALKLPNDVITYGWLKYDGKNLNNAIKVSHDDIQTNPLILITSLALYPREIIKRIGGFDVRLANHQDSEISINCFYKGYKIHFVNVCIYNHLHNNQNSIRNRPQSLLPIHIIFNKYKETAIESNNIDVLYDTIWLLFNATLYFDNTSLSQYPIVFQLFPFRYLWKHFKYNGSKTCSRLFIVLSSIINSHKYVLDITEHCYIFLHRMQFIKKLSK